MRLLFDHTLFYRNLSHRLLALPADIVPDASPVADLGLERAADVDAWEGTIDPDRGVLERLGA